MNAVKSTPNQNKAAASPNISKSLNVSLEDSSILCPDLDSQITDLLTSIRKSEENVNVVETNNDKQKETTTQDTVEIIDDDDDDEKKAGNNEHSNASNDEIKNTEDKNNESKETDTNEKNDSKELKVSTNGKEETKSGENNDTCNVKIESNGQNIETENKESPEPMETDKELEPINENSENQENCKKIEDKAKAGVKETGRAATPTRTSSRLAHSTPSTIRTRRTSRLQ